ncbi:hypothetical protein SAMN05518672_105330 [Chitinophaga sp. CF118]|uniref:hypothetical protein n=1 Tax=Chitinophaga sp. CF118 TaxID=1884367 RepID=UPI0008E4C6DE|nr:hypothetical protein [Chitinophaga sp. CF118]SFE33979.1 hypothetical protein SAMN05518672_105330 [Chitinophaga sp. CF118]
MSDKQEQQQLVEHAIAKLESKGPLNGVDTEIYKDLIALREKIKMKSYRVDWNGFWNVILHLIDKGSDFFDN